MLGGGGGGIAFLDMGALGGGARGGGGVGLLAFGSSWTCEDIGSLGVEVFLGMLR